MNRLLWFITIALLLPAAAHAQPAVPTPMSFPMDAGEHVIVTRVSAGDTIRGRVVLVGYEGLVLDDGPSRGLPLVYDIALSRGVRLPGGDLRVLAVAVYVLLVLVIGSIVTYLVVPQPTGGGTVKRRSAWSAALGFFAAVPIAYLVMVAVVQIIRPLFG